MMSIYRAIRLRTLAFVLLVFTTPMTSLSFGHTGNEFESSVFRTEIPLPNGNLIIADPTANGDRGEVKLFSGVSGKEISSLRGKSEGDMVGAFVRILANGNFVVVSPSWNDAELEDLGAVTFCDANAGCDGFVSRTNSLIGSEAGEMLGAKGVILLQNGAYAVARSSADDEIGLLAIGDGYRGTTGPVAETLSAVRYIPDQLISGEVSLKDLVGIEEFGKRIEQSSGSPFSVESDVVTISGRVTCANGRSVVGSSVILMDQNGQRRTLSPSFFGYYRFDGVQPGQTYVVTIIYRRLIFATPSYVLDVTDDVSGIDFVGEEEF